MVTIITDQKGTAVVVASLLRLMSGIMHYFELIPDVRVKED
ncbi:hypothetical protein HNO89_002487 [Sporosarcina luteola]|nr:hypothetical protein [Sporosarcina luteola]